MYSNMGKKQVFSKQKLELFHLKEMTLIPNIILKLEFFLFFGKTVNCVQQTQTD